MRGLALEYLLRNENEKPIEKRLDNEMKQYIDTFLLVI